MRHCKRLLFVLSVLFLLPVTWGHAQEVELRFDEYEEMLNAVLLTRRDEEEAFVNLVIARVRDGSIPERLVETSFKWVLNKRPGTKYPFVYFERVIRLQAERLELEEFIPPFDYKIYSERAPR